MVTRTGTGIILALFLLLAGYCIINQTHIRAEKKTIVFKTMGTVARFDFYDVNEQQASRALKAACGEFDKIIETANLYNKDSELARLNRSAYKNGFKCSDLLWKMILEAEKAYYFSNGSFDITVKPLMDVWGFYRKKGKAPSNEEIKETLKKVGFKKLHLDKKKKSIRFTVPGMALDLGGIAKGAALDLAAEKTTAFVRRGVLDLGGNLKFLGGKNNYKVGIKDPSSPDRLSKKIFEVRPESAVSTSGDYERKVIYENKVYGHIIDPLTGYPPVRAHSVTVVCESAMRADWLSTAAFLRGEELAVKAEKEFSNCHIIMVKK